MWFPEQIYTMDVLFVLFALFFTLCGIRHGLSGELAHALTLVAFLAGIGFFYPRMLDAVQGAWSAMPETAVRILVPAVLVLFSVVLFLVLRALLRQMLKNKLGEGADKVAGALAGTVRGVLLGIAVFAGLSLIPNEGLQQLLTEKSAVGGWVCNTVTPWAQPQLEKLPVLKEKAVEHLEQMAE